MIKLVYLIPLLLLLPSFPAEQENALQEQQEAKISFIFSTEGYGYSLPAGTNIIISRHFAIWYYENGTTKSFIPEFEIHGKQFGIGIIFFGLWKAPSLLKQPGNVTGMGFGFVIVFYNFSSPKLFLNFFNEDRGWTIQNSVAPVALVNKSLLEQ